MCEAWLESDRWWYQKFPIFMQNGSYEIRETKITEQHGDGG